MNNPNPLHMDDDLKFSANVTYVEALMNEAVREAPIDPMTQRFMKSRLMTRVRNVERGAVTSTVRPEAGEWEKFSPRIKMKVLRREADGSSMSYLLKLEPGAFLVPHKHHIDEVRHLIRFGISCRIRCRICGLV